MFFGRFRILFRSEGIVPKNASHGCLQKYLGRQQQKIPLGAGKEEILKLAV